MSSPLPSLKTFPTPRGGRGFNLGPAGGGALSSSSWPPSLTPRTQPQCITFVVGGEYFMLPRPFVQLHSPVWAARLRADPFMEEAEITGDPVAFRLFVEFLVGSEGAAGDVNADNVLALLHWAHQFEIEYITAMCEDFLVSKPPPSFEREELLDLATAYNMPLLYTRAKEVLAQGMHSVVVPEDEPGRTLPRVFRSEEIRRDLVGAHVSMNLVRGDGEARRRYRFADHTTLHEPEQRSRLLWKNRHRFLKPPEKPRDHDWRCLQVVWPHHSLRGDDWSVVPAETQPSMPLRVAGVVANTVANSKRYARRSK